MLVQKQTIISKYRFVFGVILLTFLFAALHYQSVYEPVNGNYGAVPKTYLDTCDLAKWPEPRGPMKAWFLCSSKTIFGNVNIVPFIFTTGLIPMTWLLATKIMHSQKRGLIAASLLFLSPILSYLGTTAALSSDWAFFFIMSLYLSYKRPEFAGVAYFISIAAKGFPMLLLPFMVWFVLKSTNQKKRTAVISLCAASALVWIIHLSGYYGIIQQDGLSYNPENLGEAVQNLWFVFRGDPIQYVLMPLGVASLILSRNPIRLALLGMILWYYSLVFLLPVFSFYTMFDYRMIPMIILVAISVSMLPKKVKSFGKANIASLGLSRDNKRDPSS